MIRDDLQVTWHTKLVSIRIEFDMIKIIQTKQEANIGFYLHGTAVETKCSNLSIKC